MASAEPKKVILQTTCAHCRKPFHISATPKSEQEGEDEIEIKCPECQMALMVVVPRRLLSVGTVFRGAQVPSVTSRKQ